MTRMLVSPLLAVAVAAGLVVLSDPAIAQPPGKGGFDKGFGKDFGKGFDKDRGFEKKGPADKGGPGGGDALRTLESELAKLKALEADLEAKLKQLKGPPPKHETAPAPRGWTAGGAGGRPGGFGPPGAGGFGGSGFGRGPGSFGPPGGFSRGPGFGPPGGVTGFGGGRGPGGPAEHARPGEHARGHESMGGSGRGPSEAVRGVVRAASHLSSQQLKEVIRALEHLEAEKHRAAAPAPRPAERAAPRPAERPSYRTEGRPESRPTPTPDRRGASSNDQILERLDRLARELDEIRRAVRK